MESTWLEHIPPIYLVIIIIALWAFSTGLLTILGWFFSRTLSKIDKNQDLLFDKYDDTERRLSTLEGEHHVLHYGRRESDIKILTQQKGET